MSNFGDYQNDIYTAGVGGVQPRFPILYGDLKKRAQEVLDARIFAYVADGSGNGLTQTKNVEAFQTYGILPRMLRDRTTRDLSVTLFDRKLECPIYVAPVGVLGAVHPDGDLETRDGRHQCGGSGAVFDAVCLPDGRDTGRVDGQPCFLPALSAGRRRAFRAFRLPRCRSRIRRNRDHRRHRPTWLAPTRSAEGVTAHALRPVPSELHVRPGVLAARRCRERRTTDDRQEDRHLGQVLLGPDLLLEPCGEDSLHDQIAASDQRNLRTRRCACGD